ncbi:JAB domain-containing protein [Bombilactobacillus thymidiniphilus]|uniref:JAB domain-containing protein n=1 Tax=Bombilactobacillus thymidiniphilus TaxID=2923363 RepID=A0ABY4PE93_9LACO|nr:JAB domain-containing protein [Bombilactobacillus thymidiniphilus]UQS83826.1 JAB domain-containing protein [Bombilactobacillus thymidiniphilus]
MQVQDYEFNSYATGTKLLDDILCSMTLNTEIRQKIIDKIKKLTSNFTDLAALDYPNLQQIGLLNDHQISGLLAAVKLSYLWQKEQLLATKKFHELRFIYQHLIDKLGMCQQETLLGMFFDNQQRLLREQIIFQGTLTKAMVAPRDIVRRALLLPCTSLLIAHNHPSGLLKPSNADVTFTQRLQTCTNLFEIKLNDHIIVGQRDYFSYAQNGLL